MSKNRNMSVNVQISVEWSGTFEVVVPASLTDDQIADCLESMDGDDIKNLILIDTQKTAVFSTSLLIYPP